MAGLVAVDLKLKSFFQQVNAEFWRWQDFNAGERVDNVVPAVQGDVVLGAGLTGIKSYYQERLSKFLLWFLYKTAIEIGMYVLTVRPILLGKLTQIC